jgi:hypothetical protein
MTIRKLNLKRLAAEYGRIYAAANSLPQKVFYS